MNNFDIQVINNNKIAIFNGTKNTTKDLFDICFKNYDPTYGMCIIVKSWVYDAGIVILIKHNNKNCNDCYILDDISMLNMYPIDNSIDLLILDKIGTTFYRLIVEYILSSSCKYSYNIKLFLCDSYVNKYSVLTDILVYSAIDHIFCGYSKNLKLHFITNYSASFYTNIFEHYFTIKKYCKHMIHILYNYYEVPFELIDIFIEYFCPYYDTPTIDVAAVTKNTKGLFIHTVSCVK